MHHYVYCSIIHDSQDMEATQVLINGWMDKEDVVYIHNGILLSHKKWWNLAICDYMGGAWGYYAKRNKSEQESQIPYDLTHKQKIKTTTVTQKQRLGWWVPKGKGGGRRAKGVIRHKCVVMDCN